MSSFTAVIMAKRPEPGRVKTRLLAESLDASTVSEIAWAMLRCTVERLAARLEVVLAVSPDGCGGPMAERLGYPSLATVDQGPGDLGQRLDRVWRRVTTVRPVAFFGADSPDVPEEAIHTRIPRALETCDLAVGPTHDGGYWTLAARAHYPQLLQGIDWGGDRVYDQTCQRAAEAGLSLESLPLWPDVDRLDDVIALRRRLAVWDQSPDATTAGGDALRRLARRLNDLCGPVPPPEGTLA